MRFISWLLVLCGLGLLGCDPPDSALGDEGSSGSTEDYFGVDGDATGAELKAQLHELIDDHEALNYRELWDALAYTDADPERPGYVVLIYTRWSLPAEMHGNDASGWNREHIWSKSRGDFGTRQGAGTDLHAIRPAEVTVNTARGNKAFDEGGTWYIDRDGPTSQAAVVVGALVDVRLLEVGAQHAVVDQACSAEPVLEAEYVAPVLILAVERRRAPKAAAAQHRSQRGFHVASLVIDAGPPGIAQRVVDDPLEQPGDAVRVSLVEVLFDRCRIGRLPLLVEQFSSSQRAPP